MTCPNCGHEVGNNAFCSNCGTKIEKGPLKHFCPNCGHEVGDSAFCSNCGTKIDGVKHSTAANADSSSQKMANDIVREINEEKQKGTFDEEEFFKKKIKQSTYDSVSFMGISKSVKSFKKNRQ